MLNPEQITYLWQLEAKSIYMIRDAMSITTTKQEYTQAIANICNQYPKWECKEI